MPDKSQLLNYIDGEFQPPAEGGWTDVVNPATGEVYATAPLSTGPDVDAAFAAAQNAFASWRRTTPGERMEALLEMADAVEQGASRLIEAEARNTGKPLGLTASEEIPPMVDQIRFFAGAARMLEGRASAEYMRGFQSTIRREPVGVVGSVAPWNYPMMMAVWKFAPAGRGQHHRPQAQRHHPGQRGADGLAVLRHPAARRVQRRLRRPRHRRAAQQPPDARDGLAAG